jgi:hypothetical protein
MPSPPPLPPSGPAPRRCRRPPSPGCAKLLGAPVPWARSLWILDSDMGAGPGLGARLRLGYCGPLYLYENHIFVSDKKKICLGQKLRHPGIEPDPPAWKADVLTTTPVPFKI